MIRLLCIAAAAASPSVLLAHDAGGLLHAHPHGSEAWLVGGALLLALLVLGRQLWGRRSVSVRRDAPPKDD